MTGSAIRSLGARVGNKLRLVCGLALVMLVLPALSGCGGGSGMTQTQRTASYTITLTLDQTAVGDRIATVEVVDRAGQPVVADEVMLTPTMRSMGMASPEVSAEPAGDGRYQAGDVLISMVGDWEMDVRVRANGVEETAMFTFNVPTE